MLASGFRLSAGVVYPDLSVQLGMSAGMAGFTASLLFYAYALMQPVSGIVNSHFGPAKISAVGLFVAALGMMLMAHVSSVPQLALWVGLGSYFFRAYFIYPFCFSPQMAAHFNGD